MDNNIRQISRNFVICCLCGAILTPTFAGFVCQNQICPDYLFEKHSHIPEQKGTHSSYFEQVNTSIGSATTLSGTMIY